MSIGSVLYDITKDWRKKASDWLGSSRGKFLDIIEPIFEWLGYGDETIRAYFMGASRLVPDDDIPEISAIKTSLLSAIINKEPIALAIVNTVKNGPKANVVKYMKYGNSDYHFGLPDLTYTAPPIDSNGDLNTTLFVAIVADLLTSLNYTKITGRYTLNIPTSYNWGLAYLQENEGYTNKITITGNDYIYVGLDEDFTDPENIISRAILTKYIDGNNDLFEYINIPPKTISYYDSYYHFRGKVKDASNNIFPFVYILSQGKVVDEGDEPADIVQMLPVVVIKKKDSWTTSGDDWYASSKTLLNKLGMDLDDYITTIKESAEDEEDIKLVTDVFFMCGFSIYSDNPGPMLYLYTYFRAIYKTMATNSKKVWNKSKSKAVYGIKFRETSFNSYVMFSYMTVTQVTGSIGSIGTLTKEIDYKSPANDAAEPIYEYVRTWVSSNGEHGPEGQGYYKYVRTLTGIKRFNTSSLIYRRQYSTNRYEEFKIHGLILANRIIDKDNYRQTVIKYLSDTDDHTFLIPVSYYFLKSFSLSNAESLILESFNLVMYASDSEDVDWYNTASFNFFLSNIIKAAGYVYMIATFDPSNIWVTVALILIARLLKEAIVRWDLSEEEMALLTVAYVAATIYIGGGFSFENAGSMLSVLGAVTATSDTISMYLEQKKDTLIEEETEEMKDLAKTQKEKLEYAESFLDDSDNIFDPLYIKRKLVIPYGSATSYYARTLTTNTTKIAVDYPSNFLKSKLSLDAIQIN